ncbi:MAG: glycosyltransferase [Phormidesmis sp.]
MFKVLTYITAYQDRDALCQCIQSIQQQNFSVDKVVVVDNSPSALLPCETNSRLPIDLLVWHYPENIGISGGLAQAIPWANSQEYDFIWMLDQDSEPSFDCLHCLIQAYEKLTADCLVGIVAPIAIDPRTKYVIAPVDFINDGFREVKHLENEQAYLCDSPITSGSLLYLKAAESVSPPDPRLFIDGVDLDYGFRLTQAGYRNFVISAAILRHNFGEPTVVHFFGRRFFFQEYSALRYYYICRNHTYLELKFSQGLHRKITCGLRRIRFLAGRVARLAVGATEHKFQKMYACLRGTYYGFLGDLDQQF